MTTRVTTTAFASDVLTNMPTGLTSKSVSYSYGGTDVTASANALIVNALKVGHGAQIVEILYRGSSGAATMPVDIGIEVTSGATNLSAFASQVTMNSTYFVTPMNGVLPYTVSCPDSQVTRYGKVLLGVTVGTATSSINLAMTVFYTYQGNT